MLTEDFPIHYPLSGAPGSPLGCKFQPSGSIRRGFGRQFNRGVFHVAASSGRDRKSSSENPEISSLLQTVSLGDEPSAIQCTSREGQVLVSHLADEPIIITSEKTQQHQPTRTFLCRRGADTRLGPVSNTADLCNKHFHAEVLICSAPI